MISSLGSNFVKHKTTTLSSNRDARSFVQEGMMMMIRTATLMFLLVSSVVGFAPLATTKSSSSSRPHHQSAAAVRLEAHKNKASDLGVARFFGIMAAFSAFSFGNIPNAQASQQQTLFAADIPAFSSSVEIADSIKTLDMSMPSYGDISNYKASVENVKSLSVDPSTGKMGIPTSKSKRSLSMSSSSSSSSSSNPAGSFLPSMQKKSAAEKKAEKAKANTPGYDF